MKTLKRILSFELVTTAELQALESKLFWIAIAVVSLVTAIEFIML